MIKNYLRLAWRNLSRNKVYSFINVIGLSIGVAASLLLFTVVKYELNYDNFLPGNKQIYHVVTQDKSSDGISYTPGIPFPALDALRVSFPQVAIGALFANYGSQVTVIGNVGSAVGNNKK